MTAVSYLRGVRPRALGCILRGCTCAEADMDPTGDRSAARARVANDANTVLLLVVSISLMIKFQLCYRNELYTKIKFIAM